ncbi:MAG: hypothetical protein ACR2JF_12250 [Iamia sp.]
MRRAPLLPSRRWVAREAVDLDARQWWSAEHLEQDQVRRLRTLLHWCDVNVPHYRDLFARVGFRPADVTAPADLSALPLLGPDGATTPAGGGEG